MRRATELASKFFGGSSIIAAEIGVADGGHAWEMLKALNPKELHLIDIWDLYIQDGIKHNFKLYYEKVVELFKSYPNVKIMTSDSVMAASNFADSYFDFVYIDALHTFEGVRSDINAWFPKVKRDGIIAGHDYTDLWPGVVEAVDDFAVKHGLVINHGQNLTEGVDDWWIV